MVTASLLVACSGSPGNPPSDVAAADGSDETSPKPCTLDEHCAAEIEGKACLRASCDVASGLCLTAVDVASEGSACDDGDPCTEGELCDTGICLGESKSCDDGDDCTEDSCDAETGACAFEASPEGALCDDGDACTIGDRCEAGVCTAGESDCVCDVDEDCLPREDGNLCNGQLICSADKRCEVDEDSIVTCDASSDTDCARAACVPASGLCESLAVNEGAACTPSEACAEAAVCSDGACVVEAWKICDDGEACTDDSCDDATGDCAFASLAEGSPCDDGDACTTEDSCDALGACRSGTPKVCDDGLDCTKDTCEPGTGECAFDPLTETEACEDGDLCTQGDRCDGQGACAPGAPRDCSDGEPCTDDACDSSTGACANPVLPENAICEDGDPCTQGEVCDAGGACQGGTPKPCDDGNDCTSDSCEAASGACVNVAVAQGEGCDDDDACTLDDRCDAEGHCVPGASKVCADQNDCTADSCDWSTGDCRFTDLPVDSACDDGLPCSEGDACDGQGLCLPGGDKDCDDSNACTADSCGVSSGDCLHSPTPGGTTCDDGDPCSVGDTCENGVCQAGSPKDCSDDEPCTIDSCDVVDGSCVHDADTLDAEPCSSGLCLEGETCAAGVCGGGDWIFDCCETTADCDDSDPCAEPSCEAHQCTYSALSCPAASTACGMPLCGVGPGCSGQTDLSARVVLFDRTPGAPEWERGLRMEPAQGFQALSDGLALADGVDEAVLHLRPIVLPPGTNSLRVQIGGVDATPIDPTGLVLEEALGDVPNVQVVDVDPDLPGFDLLYPYSHALPRTLWISLRVQAPSWRIQRLQLSHQGMEGCRAPVAEQVDWLAGASDPAAAHVASCTNDAGDLLVAWVTAGGDVRWRLRRGDVWGSSVAVGSAFGLATDFRVMCVAIGSGWALVWGKEDTLTGVDHAKLMMLAASGDSLDDGESLSSSADDRENEPEIAVLPNGDLLAVFTTILDGDSTGIGMRRFSSAGAPLGDTVIVNQVTSGAQKHPSVAVSASRVFVTWQSKLGGNKVSLARRIFLSTDLTAATDEVTYASSDEVDFSAPSASQRLDAQGAERFLVVYGAAGSTTGGEEALGVYRSEFDVDGQETVNGLPLAIEKANDQIEARASALANVDLVTWRSDHAQANTFDLVLARFDTVGMQSNTVLAKDVQSVATPARVWPGALEIPLIIDGRVALIRHGLLCDDGLYDCTGAVPRICSDATDYLSLVGGCSGPTCQAVCE